MLTNETLRANARIARGQKLPGCFRFLSLYRFYRMGVECPWEHLHPVAVVQPILAAVVKQKISISSYPKNMLRRYEQF